MSFDMMTLPCTYSSWIPAPAKGKIVVQFDKGKVLTLVGYCDDFPEPPPKGASWYTPNSELLIEKLGDRWLRVNEIDFDYNQLPGFEDWREWVRATGGRP